MKVRTVLKTKADSEVVYAVSLEQTLKDAVELMMDRQVGALLVVDNERLTSIITERDVLGAVQRYGGDLAGVNVQEVMAPQLVTCHADQSLDEAMELLFSNITGKRIRHLPVLDDGDKMLGMLSIADIVNALLTETRLENKLLRNYIKNWPEPESR